MAGKIFINYRRDDVPGDARNIRDALAARFGKSAVFMDVDNLLAGQRFDKELAKALEQCSVLVAVIGPRWMGLLSERTHGTERDYVREEIAAAMKRDIPVIPVRAGREGKMPPMPRAEELPGDIQDLVLHQKLDVAHERFGRDVEELIAAIGLIRRGGRAPLPWGKIVTGITLSALSVAIIAGVVFNIPTQLGFNAYFETGRGAGPTNGSSNGPSMDMAPITIGPTASSRELEYVPVPATTPEAADEGYCTPGAYDGYTALKADLDGDGQDEHVFAGAQMAFTHAPAATPAGYDCERRQASKLADTADGYLGAAFVLVDRTDDGIPDIVVSGGGPTFAHAGRRDGTFAEGSAGRVRVAGFAEKAEAERKAAEAEQKEKDQKAIADAAAAWADVKEQGSVAALEAFLAQFGADHPYYKQVAAERIATLKAEQTQKEATERAAKDEADRKARAAEEAEKKHTEEARATEAAAEKERQRLAMLAEEETKKAEAERQRQETERKAREAAVPELNVPCDGGVMTTVANEKRCLRPGDVFRDCDICPEMVVIPAGEFLMGSTEAEVAALIREFGGYGELSKNELPQHTVKISKAFAMAKYETTWDQWQYCVAGSGCDSNVGDDQGFGRGRRPVLDVSGSDGEAYSGWLSKRTLRSYRLPTEAEWEYAARAGSTTPFSDGKSITTDQANFDGRETFAGSKKGKNRGKTLEVGSFKPNAFGLNDLHGNASEWVADCYKENYFGAPADGSAVDFPRCRATVSRGGAWDHGPNSLRSAWRSDILLDLIGFRVARDLD